LTDFVLIQHVYSVEPTSPIFQVSELTSNQPYRFDLVNYSNSEIVVFSY
jgi:hypothetical protein